MGVVNRTPSGVSVVRVENRSSVIRWNRVSEIV
jgi:hypothetical protein